MIKHKRTDAASFVLLALAGAVVAGCGAQSPSNNNVQNGQPTQAERSLETPIKPTVFCYSSDVYKPESGLPPCYDEAGNPVTDGETKQMGFWDKHTMGYILTAAQSANSRVQTPISGKIVEPSVVEQKVAEAFKHFPDSGTYLLDISGSMEDFTTQTGRKSKWQIVAEHTFPKTADLYVFEGCQGLRLVPPTERSNLERLCCGGSTPLWNSLYELLVGGKYKERSITVITDGRSDKGAYSATIITGLAVKDRTTINILGPENAVPDLIQVTKGTGGQYRPVF